MNSEIVNILDEKRKEMDNIGDEIASKQNPLPYYLAMEEIVRWYKRMRTEIINVNELVKGYTFKDMKLIQNTIDSKILEVADKGCIFELRYEPVNDIIDLVVESYIDKINNTVEKGEL